MLADGTYLLYSLNTPTNLWERTQSAVTVATASGQTATFTLPVKAPATLGSYRQKWQMRRISGAGAGMFGAIIDVPVTVSATPALNANEQGVNLLLTEAYVGQLISTSTTFRNSGSETWDASGNYVLASENTPNDLWGAVTEYPVQAAVASGGTRAFLLTLTAPSAPGVHRQRFRMRKKSGPGAGYFGTGIDLQVTVSAEPTNRHQPTPTITCFVIETTQAYTANVGWVRDPCLPMGCVR